MTIDNSQIAPIGRAIYKDKIRDTLGPGDKGKLVVIDVTNGDYEIDEDHIAALERIHQRNPDAYTWTERVGYRAAYHMGSLPPSQLI